MTLCSFTILLILTLGLRHWGGNRKSGSWRKFHAEPECFFIVFFYGDKIRIAFKSSLNQFRSRVYTHFNAFWYSAARANPFFHNVEKWPNILWKSCGGQAYFKNLAVWTLQDFKVCLAIFQHYESLMVNWNIGTKWVNLYIHPLIIEFFWFA